MLSLFLGHKWLINIIRYFFPSYRGFLVPIGKNELQIFGFFTPKKMYMKNVLKIYVLKFNRYQGDIGLTH